MQNALRLCIIALVLAVLPQSLSAAPMVKKKKTKPDFVRMLPGNDQFLAVDKKNGTIFILGLPDMEIRTEFKGDAGRSIIDYGISPDQKWLMATFKKGNLWVWDLASYELKIKTPVKVSGFGPLEYTFLPEKDQIIVWDYGSKAITIWDIPGGAMIGSPIPSKTSSTGPLVQSPGGNFLLHVASGIDPSVRVFSLPGGQLVSEREIEEMMFEPGQLNSNISINLKSVEYASEDTINMIVVLSALGQPGGEYYKVTASIPDLGNVEKSILDPKDIKKPVWVVGWYSGSRMLDSNRKAMYTNMVDGLVWLGFKVVQLDENNQPGEDLWHLRTTKTIRKFTSWDVSTDGAWAVIGCAKTRSLYLYDTAKLIQRQHTSLGVTAEWLEPTLVKTIAMP